MKQKLNRSQTLIMDTLSVNEALTYEDIADETGLSYDGVRGRISELTKMGLPIQKLRSEGTTYINLKKKSSYRRPSDIKESITKKLSGVEDFNQMTDFLDSIRTYKTTPKKNTVSPSEEIKNAILLLSDLHFGEKIYAYDGETVIYDSDIAADRMEILCGEIMYLLDKNEVTHLNIFGLGDMVDGDSIYRNHLFRIDKPAIEQVKDVVQSITMFIKALVKYGITVSMYNVRGNHGITNYHNLEEDNWDNVVYDMLDIVFTGDENVSIQNFKSSEGVVTIGDRQFVLYHGNNFGPQIKTASGLREFRGMCGKHNLKDGDMIVVGHLHEFGMESDQGKFLIRNGSLADASEYALKLNLYSKPMQTLLFTGEELGDYPTIIPIQLE